MKYLKMLGLAAVAATALMAFAGTASATTISVNGVATNASVALSASIPSGGSAILKDTNNLTVDTCKESTVKGSTEKDTSGDYTGPSVTGTLAKTDLTFNGCSHKTSVIAAGKLHITWTAGTNGTVSSSGAEVTVESTIFGASCIAKTGTGTVIGTYTGVKSGNGSMDINGVIPMGLCGDANWTGTYTMTTANIGVEN
ncbi:MAG TPA: hypothetical protein VFN92_01795 [Solirubrobacterales bacterium]|nr:hypothetical protein [Solirubrobacterales bacterium]